MIRARADEASIVRFPNPLLEVPSQLGNLTIKADAAYCQARVLQEFGRLNILVLSVMSIHQLRGGHLGIEALFQGSEEISEEVGVGVLAQLVEHKPVAKIAMTQHLKLLGHVLK